MKELDDSQGKNKYEKEDILSKISTMMYSFGDVKEPLKESVQVMHIILRDQMDILLREAEDISNLRGGKEISHEDILFLMRKNKPKLKYLLQYLQVLDSKASLVLGVKLTEDDTPIPDNRVKMCMEFLASIEDCSEFTSLLDDIFILPEYVRKRLERRLKMIEWMTSNEYEEFAKALQVSFCPAQRTDKFKRWLLQNQDTKPHITRLALIMIGFLVRETVAEIVDKALHIKSKKPKEKKNYGWLYDPINLPNASENNMKAKSSKENEVDGMDRLNISKEEIDIINKMDSVFGENDHISKNNPSSEEELVFSDITPDDFMDFDAEDAPNKDHVPSGSVCIEKKICPDDSMDSSIVTEEDLTNIPIEERNAIINLQVLEELASDVQPGEPTDETRKSACASPSSNSNSTGNQFHVIDSSSRNGGYSENSSNDNISDLGKTSEAPESNFLYTCSVSYGTSGDNLVKNKDSGSLETKDLFSNDFDNISDNGIEDCILQKSAKKGNGNGGISDISDNENASDTNNSRVDTKNTENSNISAVDDRQQTSKMEFHRKPITPQEIREAFVQFYDPSPLVYFFTEMVATNDKENNLNECNLTSPDSPPGNAMSLPSTSRLTEDEGILQNLSSTPHNWTFPDIKNSGSTKRKRESRLRQTSVDEERLTRMLNNQETIVKTLEEMNCFLKNIDENGKKTNDLLERLIETVSK